MMSVDHTLLKPKHIKLVFLFLITTILTFGQDVTNADAVFHRFGTRIGANVSHINFAKGAPPSDIRTTWEPGVVVGVYIAVPLTKKLSLQPEYLFSQMNSAIDENDFLFKLSYLSMPIFLKYKVTQKLVLMAGPQFDLLINARSNSNSKQDLTHDIEERNIAATIGMEFALWKTLAIGGRYMHGINHIAFRQSGVVREFKFEMVQISGSFSF